MDNKYLAIRNKSMIARTKSRRSTQNMKTLGITKSRYAAIDERKQERYQKASKRGRERFQKVKRRRMGSRRERRRRR
jgi:hypothetical protein